MRARIIKTISAVKKFLRIDAEGREDETMKNVLLLEPYGYQSRPPADSQCVIINDSGINYAMNADSTENKKSLSEEETIIYSGDNAEIYLKPNGNITIKGMNITVEGTNVTVDATTKIILDSLMTEAGQLLITAVVKEAVLPLLDMHRHFFLAPASSGFAGSTSSMDGLIPPGVSPDPDPLHIPLPVTPIITNLPIFKTAQFKAG